MTSWEALYFYRIYFEAVTSTQKFANSFYGTPFLGVPTFKRPQKGTPDGPLFRHFIIIIIIIVFQMIFKTHSKTSTSYSKTLNIYNFLGSIIFLWILF